MRLINEVLSFYIAARALQQPQCTSRNPRDGLWIVAARGLRRRLKWRLCAAIGALLYGPLCLSQMNTN